MCLRRTRFFRDYGENWSKLEEYNGQVVLVISGHLVSSVHGRNSHSDSLQEE